MKKFEYKIITTHFYDHESLVEIEKLLNYEGKEGWELVQSNKDQYPEKPIKGEQIMLIFKREMH